MDMIADKLAAQAMLGGLVFAATVLCIFAVILWDGDL